MPIATLGRTPENERTLMFEGGVPQPLRTPTPIAIDSTSRGVGIEWAVYM